MDAAFGDPENTVVARRDVFGRHTGVTLQPRVIRAYCDAFADHLTTHPSGQGPIGMPEVVATQRDLPQFRVKIVSEEAGSLGIKIHPYRDEVSTCAAARSGAVQCRPAYSCQSDIHARDHS